MYMNPLKKFVHRLYLYYLHNCPIERGKYRLGVFMNLCFGKALYQINGIFLFLSPVSLIDYKLITGQEHDQYVDI